MGVTLRDRWESSLRPLFLAVLLTVAWLVWAAGSANAASDDPNSLGGIGRSASSLLQETASTAAAVADPLTSDAADVITVPQVTSQVTAAVSDLAGSTPVPAIQDVPVPVAAVPFPVSGTAATLVDAVDSPLSQTTDVVTTTVDSAASVATDTVTDTVNDTVADAVDTVVPVVDSLSPALPGVPLPTVSLPTVPVPAVPLPTLPVRLPEPGFTKEPAATEGNGIAASAQAASAQTVRNAAGLTQPVRRAISPLDFLANTHALRALVATIGYVVSAAPAPATGPDPEEALRFAALYSQSGSATGSGSAGSEASADVAAFWNPLHDARGALMPDAAQVLAAGPSFDPGSSPD
jgi:hypothetical protein